MVNRRNQWILRFVLTIIAVSVLFAILRVVFLSVFTITDPISLTVLDLIKNILMVIVVVLFYANRVIRPLTYALEGSSENLRNFLKERSMHRSLFEIELRLLEQLALFEEELRIKNIQVLEKAKFNKMLISSSPFSYIVMDKKFNIQEVYNPKEMAASQKELMGQSFLDIFPKDYLVKLKRELGKIIVGGRGNLDISRDEKHFNVVCLELDKDRILGVVSDSTEKDALLREIVHRVKNNFQMTISLLSLEQRTYADERISGALDQIKNRLQSFSTVNNFLYKYNESDKVYFAQLVQVLFSSYSFAIKKNLYFHTEQATALSFDSAFWLGLIVNELLTNTGKARVSLDDITIAPTLFFGEAKGSFKILYFDSGDYYKKIPKICMPHGKTQGMGLKLIDLFSQRLKAKYENIDAQMVTKVTHSLNIPYDKFALAEDQRAVMLTIPC